MNLMGWFENMRSRETMGRIARFIILAMTVGGGLAGCTQVTRLPADDTSSPTDPDSDPNSGSDSAADIVSGEETLDTTGDVQQSDL